MSWFRKESINWNVVSTWLFLIAIAAIIVWAFIPSAQDQQAAADRKREQEFIATYKAHHPPAPEVQPLTPKEQREMYEDIKEIKEDVDSLTWRRYDY